VSRRAIELRVADVALFYGERSGGIRSYLDAKVRQLQGRADVEHHVLVPGPAERHDGGRHELPALRIPHANGYRLPLGAGALERSIAALAPDVVLLHDPFWAPRRAAAAAHRSGARVVTVHHGSAELDAAGLRGPAAARCVVVPGEHETFGLVVLEAAASGARVVCCETAPARAQVGDLAHTFRAGDAGGLAAAVTAARVAQPDPAAAAAVALGHGWPRLFAQELEDLRALLRRSGAQRR